MPVDVQPPSRQLLKTMTTRFALQRDDWNDYGFCTLYHLHYRHGGKSTDVTYIGGVKILKRGQKAGDRQSIREPFRSLGSRFVSVGTSLDYYQRLNDISSNRRASIMDALNDAVANPELIDLFSDEEGWETSVFRDNREWRSFLADARILYEGNFGALPDIEQSFSYYPARNDIPIVFDFSAPEPADYVGPYRRLGPKRKRTLLPERMIVIVGQNGSGKSTLLARLAHLAFASPQERATKQLKALGTLDPPSLGFMRVITISYSAFDSFIVPGVGARDLTQITQDIENGDGRFVFCGLRDIVSEVRDDIDFAEQKAAFEDEEEGYILVERRTSTRLKPVEALADEFAKLLARIRHDEAVDLFNAALEPLLNDPSFADLQEQVERLFGPAVAAKKIFLGWSTGHKIALHVVASLVANARPRSLILFDEPEAHLHPPLMAALMHSVRMVLTHVNAFCIVATHSPVLLQETLARHVRHVRRVGRNLEVTEPSLETFGENVGILTYSAFGLTASSTDFHKVLDLLVRGCSSVEEIDDLFTPGLSGQARAYVLSRLALKGKE
ncbi:ATP-binding protein [Sinorhizobium fredii]|uniref:ATP-binding protein n=1 Tax=Rhizobium fredii TaxID=380 RepID=UPI0004B8F0BD|nr:ATP-binding protein [Sinorhizobium fredii]ASY71336.1 EA59 gene protein [Sinorhizobium fredii CCBAU 83666]